MSTKAAIDRLVDIIVRLRGGNGCPWDRQQTPGSMIRYMIEEVYELAEAVDTGNPDDIRDELGDVLFHILFMARMFEEKEDFGIDDVLRTIAAKMVRRHPHVFGSGEVKDSDDVVRKWHEIKRSESSGRAGQSVLDSVPSRLPALMRAYKISARAARSRFDWNTLDDVLKKLEEELAEFKAALAEGNALSVNDELGDMFFTLVSIYPREIL